MKFVSRLKHSIEAKIAIFLIRSILILHIADATSYKAFIQIRKLVGTYVESCRSSAHMDDVYIITYS